MLYLLLAILSSTMITIVMRVSNGRVRCDMPMLAVNYLTCTVLGCVFTRVSGLFPRGETAGMTYLLGGLDGVVYVAALVCMNVSTRKNGVVLANVFMRLGLLVPLALSVVFFGERPTGVQLVGILLSLIGMVVINLKPDPARAAAVPVLFLHLLCDGMASAMSKIYNQLGDPMYSEQFVLYTFAVAFLLCLVLILVRRERFGGNEVLFGVAIGVPNFFASRLLLKALAEVPAVIAYPTRGVMCIVLVTVIGIICFRERLRKHQWAAMAAILAAVALLNL